MGAGEVTRKTGRRPGPERNGKCLRRVPYKEGAREWIGMLGAQIDHVLDEQDVPVSELAAALGVREETVHRWIRGDKPPSICRIKQIADALGVMAFDLLPRAA